MDETDHRRFWDESGVYDYVWTFDRDFCRYPGYVVCVKRRYFMKVILEEFGGMILACVASLAILAMNLEMLMGPVAEKILYIVSGNC